MQTSSYPSPPASTDFDSDYGSLSIESVYPSTLSSVSSNFSKSNVPSEGFQLLNQMLVENTGYPCFGFIIDKDGTIKTAAGNVDRFLGLNASQLDNQKLMRFVSNMHRQQICSLLPSANTNAIRKQSEIEFIDEKSRRPFKMLVFSQAVHSNSQTAASFEKQSCVVCVARQVDRDPAFIIRIDRKSRQVLNVEFNDNKFNLTAADFTNSTIEKLCDQNDKPILDAIFDSPSRCSAKLLLSIRNQSILVAASKDFNGDELVLECSYIIQEHAQHHFEPTLRKLSSVSGKNFNYQQNMFSPHTSIASSYQVPDVSSTQPFQYANFQVTQQPQMQSVNLFAETLDQTPDTEGIPTVQPTKKPRKPRKPRNPSGQKRGKKKEESDEQSELLTSIPNQLSYGIGAGIGFPQITGQPYPAPLISSTVPFNPTNFDSNQHLFEQPFLSQPPTDPNTTTKKKRQRKPRNNSKSLDVEHPQQSTIHMFHQAAGSATPQSNSGFSNQSSFDAGRGTSSTQQMSSSQLAYSMQPGPVNMAPNMYNSNTMNAMPMNGLPYQMNAMGAGQPQAAWQNNGMMNGSQAEFHPIYQQQQQAQMQQMMYTQQAGMGPSSMHVAQTPPAEKKTATKRKSNQQITNPMPSNMNGMMSNGMPSNMNGMMPGPQHFQQFPQSNAMYNQQQQMLAQRQQMIANGINSPQFSPATPISYGQKSSEAVRVELRNALQIRQNANSPSSQPNVSQLPHTVQQPVMSMSNDINSARFPSSNETAPNLLSPPRLSNNQQVFNGMQQSQQNLFNMQSQARLNGPTSIEKSDYPFSDFDLDHKPSELFHNQDDLLHIDTTFYDFRLLSGRFNLENEETRLAVEKLLG